MAAVKTLPVISLLFSSLALGLYSGAVAPRLRALDKHVEKIHELEERGLAEHFVQANDKLARFEGRLEEQDERLEEMTRRLERVESRG